jgi:cytochrome c peroxidase
MRIFLWLCLALFILSCKEDDTAVVDAMEQEDDMTDDVADNNAVYQNYVHVDFDNLDTYTPILPEHYDPIVDAVNTPIDNPITDEGATLGRILFYDKQLSRNNTVSCASCHSQDNGFDDPNEFSTGFEGGLTGAHAMRLLNAQFYQGINFFWDKRAENLEVQTTQPIQNDVEMGFDAAHGGFEALISKMNDLEYYPELFQLVYGDATITEERTQKAMAQFIRAMVSVDSKFDQGYAQVYQAGGPGNNIAAPFPNYTDQENQGKLLFVNQLGQGGAACAACHLPPSFALNLNSRSNGLDFGEGTVFKSPSLKSAGTSTHFMHDGRFSSIAEVIEHYNSGIESGPALDVRLRAPTDPSQPLRLNLSETQKLDLEAFINTLTDTTIAADARFSDPFIN